MYYIIYIQINTKKLFLYKVVIYFISINNILTEILCIILLNIVVLCKQFNLILPQNCQDN